MPTVATSLPPSTPRPTGWETKKSPELVQAFADLAALDATMTTERANYQKALGVINRLTNYKRTPVVDGSPAFHECLRAKNVIDAIDASAPTRIAERARLEAIIKAHGGDPSIIRASATPAAAAP